MIPILLLDELTKFLKEANKDFRLTDESIKENKLIVSPGYLRRSEKAAEIFFPHIILRLIKAADEENESHVEIRIYFGTYCEDATNGWRELFNLMEHTRQALLKKRTIANQFRLELPIKYEILEEQPYPEWVGFMDVKYSVTQPREELNYVENIYGTVWEKNM